MALIQSAELPIVEAMAALNYTNPFVPERRELERIILGGDYVDLGPIWSIGRVPDDYEHNISNIRGRVATLLDKLCARLQRKRISVGSKEISLYQNLVIYHLFDKYRDAFLAHVQRQSEKTLDCYPDFLADLQRYHHPAGREIPLLHAPDHIFSLYFQIHRAFHHIFYFIVGGSPSTGKLRASIWESIFTHNMVRYSRSLFDRMNDLTSLVCGPSGTGKELVARAIAFCRYIPFDVGRRQFRGDFREQFFPLHLSALASNLIESELFGHKKGAFTGALQDRASLLELCSQYGTVFLDEIGEINEEIQVKLLRLLQDRSFQRIGETKSRVFRGKIILATNRDLAAALRQGCFRSDLYYRICSDMITTPSLREQLQDAPGELSNLVHFLANRVVGEEEAESLTDETVSWIRKNLGKDYAWPGNVRELEQCVRNVLVRGEYHPPEVGGPEPDFMAAMQMGQLTAEEVLDRYCCLLYDRTGSYSKTAKALRLDWRTVKSRIERTGLASSR